MEHMLDTCPLLSDFEDVLARTDDLSAAMRKLNRARSQCKACRYNDSCPLWVSFHEALDDAVDEVLKEWRSR